MSRFVKGMMAAAADALGLDAKTVSVLASDYAQVNSDVRAGLPGRVTDEAVYQLTQFLYGSVVTEVFGQVIGARVGLAIAGQAGRSGDAEAERHRQFSMTVHRLADEGLRFSGARAGSTDHVLAVLYLGIKLALAMSDIDDGDMSTLDQCAAILRNAMIKWGVRLHYVRGLR